MNRKVLKRLLGGCIAGMMAFAVAGCGGSDSGSSGDIYEMSYWIPAGIDNAMYGSYEENPVVQYIENNYEFNGKPIHFEYYVAPAGSESDNFTTLLSTGEYCDIMNLSMSSQTPAQLYGEDILADLTDLVPEYMPNYMAFIAEHPELEQNLYSLVDGEKKILHITGFRDGITPNYEGFSYRRDWVAKYGKNPETGAAFTYGFENPDDPYSWQDDVVFPSGSDEPIYISDWEWMFEIFDQAMADLGITDGYCYAPYYQGYMQTGDFASAFGGGGVCYWYRNSDNVAVFGPTTDNFRAYVQCLNTWYGKGWVDPAFAEHNSDIFYAVDTAKVFSGKVGLWQGRQSAVGTQIDDGSDFTSGAVVYGCRQPINDVYGGPESQNVEPYVFLQNSMVGNSIGVTTNLSEDEIIAFLEYTDFLFSEEGSALALGLNAEQQQSAQNEFYNNLGLSDGAIVVENGEYRYTNPNLTQEEKNAVGLSCVGGRLEITENLDYGYDRYVQQATDEWDYYKAGTSLFDSSVQNAISVEDGATVTNVRTNVDQFMVRSVSAMIMGNAYDVWDDASWEQFCTDINKFQPDMVTDIYNNAIQAISN